MHDTILCIVRFVCLEEREGVHYDWVSCCKRLVIEERLLCNPTKIEREGWVFVNSPKTPFRFVQVQSLSKDSVLSTSESAQQENQSNQSIAQVSRERGSCLCLLAFLSPVWSLLLFGTLSLVCVWTNDREKRVPYGYFLVKLWSQITYATKSLSHPLGRMEAFSHFAQSAHAPGRSHYELISRGSSHGA